MQGKLPCPLGITWFVSLEAADQAVVFGIAINLAKKGKARLRGIQFTVHPKDGMALLHPEMLHDSFIGCNGLNLLFPSLYLYLVMFTEDVEKRTVLKGPGCEPGKVQVGYHGDVVKYRLLIDKP